MKFYKSYAKVNIFLKVTSKRGDYHEIVSRFVIVDGLYDVLSFEQHNDEKFIIDGNFSCDVESNTIFKAYLSLRQYTKSKELENLLKTHKVVVEKNIPAFAGLGGGSSNAATFLKMCNEVLHLGLSLSELAKIGLEVGADVPFFVYNYKSANVSGIGEIVEEFDEESLKYITYTPKIEISTPCVYKRYSKSFYNPIDASTSEKLKNMKTIDLLDNYDSTYLNDLFAPALYEYSNLKEHIRDDYFFSGSGSSFFKLVNP